MLVVPRNHALAELASIRMSSLKAESFIIYTEDAPGLRMATLHACEVHGFTPRIAQEAVQVTTILSLVEAGLGIALVPSISRSTQSELLVWIPVADLPESASIGISIASRQENETTTAKNFQAVAREVFPADP